MCTTYFKTLFAAVSLWKCAYNKEYNSVYKLKMIYQYRIIISIIIIFIIITIEVGWAAWKTWKFIRKRKRAYQIYGTDLPSGIVGDCGAVDGLKYWSTSFSLKLCTEPDREVDTLVWNKGGTKYGWIRIIIIIMFCMKCIRFGSWLVTQVPDERWLIARQSLYCYS